jgi:hypothetical protein
MTVAAFSSRLLRRKRNTWWGWTAMRNDSITFRRKSNGRGTKSLYWKLTKRGMRSIAA